MGLNGSLDNGSRDSYLRIQLDQNRGSSSSMVVVARVLGVDSEGLRSGCMQLCILRHRAGLDAPFLGALENPRHDVEVSLNLCLRLGIRRSPREKLHIVEHHHQRPVHSIDRRLVQDVIQDSAKRVLIGVPGTEPDGFSRMIGCNRAWRQDCDRKFQNPTAAGSGDIAFRPQSVRILGISPIIGPFFTSASSPANVRRD